MPDQNTIPYLIKQHIHGEITESEQNVLNEWLAARPENRLAFGKITNTDYLNDALAKFYSYENDKEKEWEILNERINPKSKVRRLTIKLSIAASILVVLAIGIYFLIGNRNEPGNTVTTRGTQQQSLPDIAPGAQKA